MKLKYKLLLIPLLMIVLLSCGEDNEPQQDKVTEDQDETNVKDPRLLMEDEQFIDYIKNLHKTALQIDNVGKVQEIISDVSEIPEERMEELAQAMRFASVTDLETFFETQSERIADILERYDFDNSSVSLASVFNQMVQQALAENAALNIGGRPGKSGRLENDCPGQDIEDICLDNYLVAELGLNNPEFIEEYFCGDFTGDSPTWNKCMNKISLTITIQQNELLVNWCKCMQSDCEWSENIQKICDEATGG